MIQRLGDVGRCLHDHFSWIVASEPIYIRTRRPSLKYGSLSNGKTPKFGLKATLELKVAGLVETFYAEMQKGI